MDDPFDALASPPGRGPLGELRRRLGVAQGHLGAGSLGPGSVAPALAAVGIVAALAVGAWWLANGRAQPVELPNANDAAVTAPAGSPTAAPAAAPPNDGSPGSTPAASALTEAEGSTTLMPPDVVVHVAGQVHHPGLYTVNAGGRLADAVDAAGGVTAQADLDRVNLAEPLTDGARAYIPAVGQIEPPGTLVQGVPTAASAPAAGSAPAEGSAPVAGAVPVAGELVNLNTADASALEELPGVGPVTAAAIVEHRTEVGTFSQVEDLLEVRGIGDAKLEALVDLVTV